MYPHVPKDKIVIHELLNHRSGIRDDFEIYGPHWSTPKGDPKIKLDAFLKDYLNKEGALYGPKNFAGGPDNKDEVYSNTGYALLGLIIEQVSGVSLEAFSKSNIFKPLGMKNTSWFLGHLDETQVAKTYAFDDSGGYVFKGHNGYPDYPAGQLRTSISDFTRLIAGYLNAGEGSFVLKHETTRKITPDPGIARGGFYTWFLEPMNSHLYYAHGGGDIGTRAIVLMDVAKRNAIILVSNSEIKVMDLLKAIEEEVFPG